MTYKICLIEADANGIFLSFVLTWQEAGQVCLTKSRVSVVDSLFILLQFLYIKTQKIMFLQLAPMIQNAVKV